MRILHLEDNGADAELTHELFRAEWPDCAITLVDDRPRFLSQLAAGHDLILSDFNLVSFNGLEALQIARAQAPSTPFVFLSGTIGEDRAIEALQAGASDYVIKDRPKRLMPAIRRALADAQRARESAQAAEQMLRIQRLENVGLLAAGIAHDINNVLAPIVMGVSLLRSRATSPLDERILGSMEASATRGTGLVKQILGFAHGVAGEPQIIDPKHLIRDLGIMMQQTFPKTIRLEEDLPAGLWPITANPTQFHQILLNLCVNARDAMPAGGTLTLRASNRTLTAPDVAAGAPPGEYFQLEIQDTGDGIPPEIRQRIWEPFFTTKGADRGTGLGLATVRGIVADHSGFITLESTVGVGTRFTILLPASRHSTAVNGELAAAAVPRGNGQLILIVDDDASVREVTCSALTSHGYYPLAAADGPEAVALFAMRSQEFAGVITDLDMPGMDGAALVKVVQTLNPAVRILIVSGSSDETDPRRQPPPSGRFLAKPFSTAMLLQTVHELLT